MVARKKIKYKILTTLLIAFSLIMSPVATLVNNVSSVVYADTQTIGNVDGDTIEVIGFKNQVKFNEKYVLPQIMDENEGLLSYGDIINNSSGYTYKVYQNIPKKEVKSTLQVEPEEIDNIRNFIHKDGENWIFYALTTGTYTIEITKQVGDKIITAVQNQNLSNKKLNGLTVNVIAETYSIKLPANSQHIVPQEMPLLEGDDMLSLSIPRPTVLSKTGEEISEEDYSNLEVLVNDEVININQDGTYKYTPTSRGNYEIKYRYKVGGVLLGREYQEFKVVMPSSFNLDKLELKVEFTGSIEERMIQGEVSKLPGAYAVNQNGERIDAHITIKAVHISSDNQPTDVTEQEVSLDDFTITPTKLGNYWIYYKAVHSLFGIESEEIELPNGLVEVVDASSFDILLVNDYEIDIETNNIVRVNGEDVSDMTEIEILELLGNKDASVPNLVIIPENEDHIVLENILPAIYAKDNFTTGYENFEFTRMVRDGTNNTNLFVLDASGNATDNYYENYQSASFRFEEPKGSSNSRRYTFTYTATDKTNNAIQTRTFYINVLKENYYKENYEVKPTLQFSVDKDEIYADGMLTFAKPTVKDENIDYKDNNIDLDILVEFNVSNNIAEKTITGKQLEDLFNTTTNQYEIELSELGLQTITNAVVTAFARNDYYNQVLYPNFDIENLPAQENDLPVHIRQEITVLLTDDQDAPEFQFIDSMLNNVSLGDALYDANTDQIEETYPELTEWIYTASGKISINGEEEYIFFPRDTITLPAVAITDADKNLKYSIHIFNNGNRVYLDVENPSNNYMVDAFDLVISGAQFEASLSGLYEVIYQIEDGLGNITIKTFGIRVGQSSEPAMVVTTFPKTAELGQEFIFPKIVLSNGNVIETNQRQITISAPNGYINAGESPTGFVPNVAGEYKIEYLYQNGSEETTTSFVLNVTDTIAPEIGTFYKYGYFANNDFKKTIKWEEEDKNTTLKVYLPMYTAFDSNNNLDDAYLVGGEYIAKITVRNQGNSIMKTTAVVEQGYHLLELSNYDNHQGQYTVEYTVSDRAGNQAVQQANIHTFVLKIGNAHSPEVEWEEGAIPASIELGEEWILPIDKMTITDLDEDEYGDTHDELIEIFKNKGGTVRLTSPSGREVDSIYAESGEPGLWGWEFDEIGDYKLSLIVYDQANNRWERTYNINVSAPQPIEDINISNTVGTILIILSIAVLSGVVIYFLFSNKRLSKVEVKSQNTKKE